MVESLDHALALSLQESYDREEVSVVQETVAKKGIVDKHWELADPNPDIFKLFMEYDSMFFWNKLAASGVAVDWSNRMTM